MMRRILAIGVVLVIASLTGCNYFGQCVNGSGLVISEVREIEDFTGVVNTASFDLIVTRSDTYSVEVRAQENLLPIIETYISGNTLIIEIENGVCLKSNSNVEVHVSMPETELLGLTGSGRVFADVLVSTEVEVSNSGSGYMEIDSVLTETLDLGNSGSGHISILGSYVNIVDAVQSGSGSILCGTLFGVVEVDIRHSSSGRVSAILLDGVELDVVLSGSGRVELSGDVEVAEYSLNSSGRIDALELEVSDVDATNTGSGNIYVWATDLLDATITGSGDIIYLGNPELSISITGSGSLRSY
ncbi:MAG: hypothetical protein DRI97_03410 [Bacteroidetes bacterium]|nr:MAG: hypothetical protein DRI97_03410 [Bacteroidota bacterium]RLD92749.1 MAG: hypothetical protein DRJ29_10925 [Bacteroidota bacterium]